MVLVSVVINNVAVLTANETIFSDVTSDVAVMGSGRLLELFLVSEMF